MDCNQTIHDTDYFSNDQKNPVTRQEDLTTPRLRFVTDNGYHYQVSVSHPTRLF